MKAGHGKKLVMKRHHYMCFVRLFSNNRGMGRGPLSKQNDRNDQKPTSREGLKDARVLKVMAKVPGTFCRRGEEQAYADHPLPIGEDRPYPSPTW
jgi:hypothetical protein